MTTRHRGTQLIALAGLLLLAASPSTAQQRHRAPPPPPANRVYRSVQECNLNVPRYGKRHRCRKCIEAGGRFHTLGAGRCALPPPVNRVLRQHLECNSIPHYSKRTRCRKCVRAAGSFHTQGAGPGHCALPAPPPPPPPPPPPANQMFRSIPECNLNVPRYGKRNRCRKCVQAGGVFHTQGAGFGHCAMPAPVNRVLYRHLECNSIPRYGKRKRCRKCVAMGWAFHTQGPGHGACVARAPQPPPPPPPPPPASHVLRSPPECQLHGMRRGKRRRCHKCVRRGWAFHTQGMGYGVCVARPQARPAPPPPPPAQMEVLHTPAHCNAYIHRKSKRRHCFKCVGRGGRFHRLGGARHGRCVF